MDYDSSSFFVEDNDDLDSGLVQQDLMERKEEVPYDEVAFDYYSDCEL